MKLIKVGNRVLNLSNVVAIELERELEDGETGIRVYVIQDSVTNFKGEEAAALRQYFLGQALDVDQLYKDHLEAEELKRYRADWRKRFEQFWQEKGLDQVDQNARYYYELYLLDGEQHPIPGGNQPGEESFIAWQAFVEEQIIKKIERLAIPEQNQEAYKVYCKVGCVINPSWNHYAGWESTQQTKPVGV